MADAQSRFAAMPPKQKATVVVAILVVIFMLYEAMGFFHSSTPALPTTGPAAAMGKMSPTSAAHPGTGSAVANLAPPPPPPPAEPKPAVAPEAKVEAPGLPPELEQAQEQYLSAINNLQMLKVQREIAETDEAIAAAKLATVTAEKSISDLLTIKPPPPPPPIPSNAYLQKLGGPGGEGGLSSASTLTVLSVSMEHNQWHAVIGQQGKLFNVSVGDTLPTDGSSVAGIDQGGVLLEKDGVQKKIPLVASIQQ